MSTWLVNHAAENVWCRPSDDGRFIIKPQRICGKRGDVFGIQASEHHIQLPDTSNWYHSYQIGLQDPEELGFKIWGGWKSAKQLVNDNGILIFAYTTSGRQIPLDLVYFRFISNHNLLVSVKRYETQVNLGDDDLYIKIYRGLYQGHPDWTDEHKITCESFVIRSSDDISNLVVRYGIAASKPGKVYCSINGYPVDKFTIANIKPWDYVEMLHDGTVKEVHEWYLDDLPDFFSELDKTRKFLVHLPRAVDTVLHLNDLEVYLYKGDNGRFVHTHLMANLRQLTHRDFSLETSYIYDYGVTNPDWWAETGDVKLRIYVRNPALGNKVEFDANRILEMYQMSDAQIISAMVGPDDSLDIWKASNLENSPYSRLINARPENITRKLVTDAYGYNASSKLLGYNYTPVYYDGQDWPHAPIEFGMIKDSTVFEYDKNGLLLGYVHRTMFQSSVHRCTHRECAFIECIEGEGTRSLDIEFGTTMSKVDPQYQYRYYLDSTISEQPSWKYTEVTDSNAYDILADGTVAWHVDTTRFLPVRQSDKKFLLNTYTFSYDTMVSGSGLLYFNAEYDNTYNGKPVPLEFEPETVEVWLNGKSLVIGLGAVVAWPFIGICDQTIVNLDKRKDFEITLRVRNFIPRGTKYQMPKHGFIYDGILSNNYKYDIKDDKVIRIIAGGRMYDRSDVEFREDAIRINKRLTNGTPYQITDPLIPLRNHVEYPTYPMHAIAKRTDADVEAYLTQKIPLPPAVDTNPFPNRYNLYSLTLNKLILDMLRGEFEIKERPGNYIPTTEVEERMEPYLRFLEVDAARLDIDPNYVNFYPVALQGTVDIYPLEFSFIERVNTMYFGGRVILNTQLKVKDRP